jgi:transposase
VANRIQKLLEDASIKLASVARDALGVSRRDMPRAIIEGQEDPEALAQFARRKLRAKIPQLRELWLSVYANIISFGCSCSWKKCSNSRGGLRV